ncbi:MAG: NTP/NDP exchange transporter [Chlamydiia bacterium]|nr:NTP/NDP exchange transporter [Chlamydiia bacterium]
MQDQKSSHKPFSKWRRRLLPVHGRELSKFLPLLFMKLLVSFNYTILHSTKDTLIVTGKGSGAEVIPLLKGGVVLIAAFLFMLIYSRLSNSLTPSKLFYTTITPFLIFFALYGFFLYPNREWLSPHSSADLITSYLGESRAHWVVIWRYWMDSLFFLMAELWGGVVIALLFWGFANRINTLTEAGRFYPLLSAGGHLGVIASGPLLWKVAHWYPADQFASTIQVTMGIATAVTLLIILSYWWIDRNEVSAAPETKKEKNSLSLHDGLFQVLKSPSLAAIALMVIGYGLSVNMVEVLWKATLKQYYPLSKDYQAFMGIVSFATGLVSLFLALFVGGNILRKWGWQLSAQLTPLILGLASVAFLAAYFFGSFFGVASLATLVTIGAIHNVACKSMKYCLFDPTKEMAYIPLSEDIKVKGKAAVDVVASRFGKSGSSWIQIGLMEALGTSSVLITAPYLTPFILIALIAWSSSILYLGKSRTQLPA